MRRRIFEPHSAGEAAAINCGITLAPDNPELTAEVMPELVAAGLRQKRGAQKKPTKVLVSLRLEPDILAKLRASGPGWQTRTNDLLRKALFGT